MTRQDLREAINKLRTEDNGPRRPVRINSRVELEKELARLQAIPQKENPAKKKYPNKMMSSTEEK